MALTIREAHSRYSLEWNRQRQCDGHLWQNRFYSCPLEDSHLMATLHYVELNPVRARMVDKAWDWQWSSARAHTKPGACDVLLDWPWLNWMKEARLGEWDHAGWQQSLQDTRAAEEAEAIRRATKLGEPLGCDAFLQRLEGLAGRRLRVLPQGRPKADKALVAAG